MSQEDKVVYLHPPMTTEPTAEQEAFLRVRQQVLGHLGELLAAMLDQVDDALFERAEKAEHPQLQGAFFTAMRQIRLSRRRVEADFLAALEQEFARFNRRGSQAQPRPAAAPISEDSLTLLDNEALEQSIAVDGMVAKTKLREARRLEQLLRCLEALFPHQHIGDHHPLDPARIVQAFVGATAEVEMEIAPRLILFKLFDTQVLGSIGGLYEGVCQLLLQAGVRPAPARPRNTAEAAERQEAPQSLPVAPSRQATLPLQEGLRRLFAEQALASVNWLSGADAAEASPAAASLDEVVGALSLLQRHAGVTVGQEVKQALGQYLPLGIGGARQQVGSLEGAAIDIVGMLFDVILEDPRLPPRIKALLARLQIPVLKVALLDGAFFSSKQHPARRLINEMARAATGWVEPEQFEHDALYSQIKRAVERILNEFDADPQVFSEVLDDFLIFQEEEQERARLVEERTRQAAEGQAKVEAAKAHVSATVQQRLQAPNLPEVVRQLLAGAWSKVLFLAYLKAGEDGAEWQQQLSVTDRLIASVRPPASVEARRAQLLEIPLLLQDLRDGLNAILFNPFEMEQFFKQLELEHVRCLTAAPEQAEADSTAAPPVEPAAAVPPAPAEADADLAEHGQQVDQLPLGTWLEFEHSADSRVRTKLSARVSDGQQLIFVNRAGFKMYQRSREELARELRDGRAVVLDDEQLFDKALEAVIADLRRARAKL